MQISKTQAWWDLRSSEMLRSADC